MVRIRHGMSALVLVGTVAVSTLGLACDDVASSKEPLDQAITMDVFPKDGNDEWRVEVVGVDHRTNLSTSDYLVRVRDAQGQIIEERQMKWRDMMHPEASGDVAFLMSDPTFPTRLQELREDGLSVADIVSELARLLAERGDDSSGEVLDALETRLRSGGGR